MLPSPVWSRGDFLFEKIGTFLILNSEYYNDSRISYFREKQSAFHIAIARFLSMYRVGVMHCCIQYACMVYAAA